MARIADNSDKMVLKIESFLGLNENQDGSTTLKVGEMSVMRNFRITQDRHLQIRPGTKIVDGPYSADDTGGVFAVNVVTINNRDHLLVLLRFTDEEEDPDEEPTAQVWDVTFSDEDKTVMEKTVRGHLTKFGNGSFFGFDDKVYLLCGNEYYVWDGSDNGAFSVVEGYVPIVQTATTPDGAGTLLEGVNRLNGKRRVQFSPDGTATVFTLPEKNLTAVDRVTLNGSVVSVSGYTANLVGGTVTFNTAPESGTNTVEIWYAKGAGNREQVTAMRYCEFYNGNTDARVFLYGDGSNRTIYSGIEIGSGKPSAEYFPDLYEIAVGESNTPLTALIRHYSKLMAYKSGSAWSIQYDTISLADGSVTSAFYCNSVNRQIGNDAPGQVCLLENNPVTLDANRLYQWRSGTSYGATIVNSENNAKRISDRIGRTLRTFSAERVKFFNVKTQNELWVMHGHDALVLNQAADTWSFYTDLPFDYVAEVDNELYGIGFDAQQSENGRDIYFTHISREYRGDLVSQDRTKIRELDCHAETGSMDFNRDWVLKYSPMLFVAMQPESNARISVTVQTDRKSDYAEKVVAYNLSTFLHVDFNHFSFGTNRKPQVRRLKIKVKKATFYRIIYSSHSASATATVLETDVMLRYAGNVK